MLRKGMCTVSLLCNVPEEQVVFFVFFPFLSRIRFEPGKKKKKKKKGNLLREHSGRGFFPGTCTHSFTLMSVEQHSENAFSRCTQTNDVKLFGARAKRCRDCPANFYGIKKHIKSTSVCWFHLCAEDLKKKQKKKPPASRPHAMLTFRRCSALKRVTGIKYSSFADNWKEAQYLRATFWR